MHITDYRHIIWDWNGTLLDDCALCVDVMNTILARRAMPPVSVDAYRAHFDFPVRRYYEWLGFGAADTFETVSHEFIAGISQRNGEACLQKDAITLLEVLHARKIEQVILSAHKQDTLEAIVAYYQLGQYFTKIIGLDNIFAEGKVENGRAHIATLRHAPHEVLLVGDTTHDAEVARIIGADCILVSSGHQSPQRLKTIGYPVVSSLAELLTESL